MTQVDQTRIPRKKDHVQFSNVPVPFQETLEWLLEVEDYQTVRSLAKTIYQRLPKDHPESTDFLGYFLFKSKDYLGAATAALQTVKLLPESPDAHFNAGKCLNATGNPVKAEGHAREALRLRPGWIDGRIELAVYIALQGRSDEGMRLLLDLRSLLPDSDPNRQVVDFNLGWHHVRLGDFKLGMKNLKIGRKLNIWGARARQFPAPMFDGSQGLGGKTVLLCGEGGAGDEMINVRFAQVIRQRGGRALWMSRQKLDSILARATDVYGVVQDDTQVLDRTRFDLWAPCMDLPQLLDLDLAEVPNQPYITPDPARVKAWSQKIQGDFKIGVRWQGNALYEQDLFRSVPFSLFEKLTSIPEVQVYSLQRDEGTEDLTPGSKVVDLSAQLTNWEETAAIIANLDLVISSCTSIVHLAAAMGKPTWVLCPKNCYYLWAPPGDRSHWYPSVTLFRQTQLQNWDEPFGSIMARLQKGP